jgi:hypothetical protein
MLIVVFLLFSSFQPREVQDNNISDVWSSLLLSEVRRNPDCWDEGFYYQLLVIQVFNHSRFV